MKRSAAPFFPKPNHNALIDSYLCDRSWFFNCFSFDWNPSFFTFSFAEMSQLLKDKPAFVLGPLIFGTRAPQGLIMTSPSKAALPFPQNAGNGQSRQCLQSLKEENLQFWESAVLANGGDSQIFAAKDPDRKKGFFYERNSLYEMND